jgi:hypothetical protein
LRTRTAIVKAGPRFSHKELMHLVLAKHLHKSRFLLSLLT